VYKEQSIRLLRTSWKSPDTLAEELYAIFQQETPITMDGPITIRTKPGQPGIIFEQPEEDFGVIDPIQNRPPLGNPSFGPEAEQEMELFEPMPVDIPELQTDVNPPTQPGEDEEEEEDKEETRSVIVRTYVGSVVEGKGKLWEMNVWNNGLDKPPNTYKVNVYGVADDVDAPEGAYYLVTLYLVRIYRGEELVKETATFACVPPVWL